MPRKANPQAQAQTPKGLTPAEATVLRAEIARMQQGNEQLQRTVAALMAQPQPQPQQRQEESLVVPADLSNMPDPSVDRAAYDAELSKRLAASTDATFRRATQASNSHQQTVNAQSQARDAKLNKLWADFGAAHPELVANPHVKSIVDQAARERAADIAAQGLDVERYIFANPEGFLDELARNSKDRLTALGWKAPAPSPAAGAVTDASLEDGIVKGPAYPISDAALKKQLREHPENAGESGGGEADDEGRADVLGGMATQSGGPAAQRTPKSSNLTDEIRDIQRSSGFF